jgi:hypothetical protein
MQRAGRIALRPVARLGMLAMLLLLAAGAAPAWAGTLSVQLGTSPSGCIAASWDAPGLTGDAYCTDPMLTGLDGWGIYAASQSVSAGATGHWEIDAPAGITIDSVTLPNVESQGLVSSGSYGWQAGDYWSWGEHRLGSEHDVHRGGHRQRIGQQLLRLQALLLREQLQQPGIPSRL